MAKIVLVIAQRDFRDEELFHTKEELEKAGHKTIVASRRKGECTGMLGGKAKAEISLEEIKTSDFQGIVFVGGGGSAEYFNDAKALNLAKEFFKEEKLVCAICIAPSILANAGLLKEKKATCFSSEAGNLKAKGANYTGKPVETDGKIITADGPKSAREFGKKIVSML